jgi:hypothetical protein
MWWRKKERRQIIQNVVDTLFHSNTQGQRTNTEIVYDITAYCHITNSALAVIDNVVIYIGMPSPLRCHHHDLRYGRHSRKKEYFASQKKEKKKTSLFFWKDVTTETLQVRETLEVFLFKDTFYILDTL